MKSAPPHDVVYIYFDYLFDWYFILLFSCIPSNQCKVFRIQCIFSSSISYSLLCYKKSHVGKSCISDIWHKHKKKSAKRITLWYTSGEAVRTAFAILLRNVKDYPSRACQLLIIQLFKPNVK